MRGERETAVRRGPSGGGSEASRGSHGPSGRAGEVARVQPSGVPSPRLMRGRRDTAPCSSPVPAHGPGRAESIPGSRRAEMDGDDRNVNVPAKCPLLRPGSSRYSSTTDAITASLQERQIVQSTLNLDDFLPRLPSPRGRL